MSCFNIAVPRIIEFCNPNIHQKGMIHPQRLMHVHDFLYCASGSWEIYMDGKPFFIQKDDLLILHAGVEHFGKIPCEKETKVYFFHVFPADGDSFEDVTPLPNGCVRLDPVIHCQNNPEIKKLCKEIIATFWLGTPQSTLKTSLLLRMLMLRLSETEQHLSDKTVSLAERCIRLMDHAPHRFLSPDEMARTLFVSERTLRNAFKQVYHTTPYHYQRDMKLKKAVALMREYPDLQIRVIAESLGFYDECHFSKVFKDRYGVSPGSYRHTPTENDEIPGIAFIPTSDEEILWPY